jgi:hypothetical protein
MYEEPYVNMMARPIEALGVLLPSNDLSVGELGGLEIRRDVLEPMERGRLGQGERELRGVSARYVTLKRRRERDKLTEFSHRSEPSGLKRCRVMVEGSTAARGRVRREVS